MVSEHRFHVCPDGTFWQTEQVDSQLQEYLEIADKVIYVCRTTLPAAAPPELHQLTDPRIRIIALNSSPGLSHVARARVRAAALAPKLIPPGSNVGLIIRAPSTVGRSFAGRAKAQELPYAVEVLGEAKLPSELRGIRHALNALSERTLARETKYIVANASVCLYVTQRQLQELFPPNSFANQFAGSDVELPDEWFLHPFETRDRVERISTIGSLAFPYKGIDVLLKALALIEPSVRPKLSVVGDGRLRGSYEAMASGLGIADGVDFLGQLPRVGVREVLASSDIYVTASRTEGLPRSVVEAMALGVPIIGSAVGGICELLEPKAMVEAGDPALLSAKIREFADRQIRTEQSKRNRAAAEPFRVDNVSSTRADYLASYRKVAKDRQATKLSLGRSSRGQSVESRYDENGTRSDDRLARLTVVLEHRFQRAADRSLWMNEDLAALLSRYEGIAKHVSIIARSESVGTPASGAIEVDLARYSVSALNNRPGALNVALARARAWRYARQILNGPGEGLIVRAPSTVGYFFARRALQRGVPYGAEIVGEGSLSGSASRFTQIARERAEQTLTRETGYLAAHAAVTSYVSETYLQERFPAKAGVPSYAASNALIPEDWFQRDFQVQPQLQRLICVASLAYPYKGIDELLVAVKILSDRGSTLDLTIVGDGRLRPHYELQAQRLGLDGHVEFLGQIGHERVGDALASADLCICPSTTEGIPRSVIESMVLGVPVVGTAVGGIPELLEPESTCAPADPKQLVQLIERFEPQSIRQYHSVRNRSHAERFKDERLSAIRSEFLTSYKEAVMGGISPS